MRRFQGSAFGRAFSILGDSHLAEDAVQDAFVEAFRNLGSLLAPEAFPSWFQRIVLTACNRITRKRTLPASSLDPRPKHHSRQMSTLLIVSSARNGTGWYTSPSNPYPTI